MQFTYPEASIKDAQATGEAFGTQKRTASTSKHENSLLFSVLWVIFALLDPKPATQLNADSFGSGSTTLLVTKSHKNAKDSGWWEIKKNISLNTKQNFIPKKIIGSHGA